MAQERQETSGRAILTVLGSDRAGIVAAVTAVLARHDANILDPRPSSKVSSP